MLKNLFISADTRFLLKESAKTHHEPMHAVASRFLRQYQYASNYAKEYDRQGRIYCDYELPKPIDGRKTNLQINYPKEDWEDLKREATLRNIPLNEFIDAVLLLVAMDFHELDEYCKSIKNGEK